MQAVHICACGVHVNMCVCEVSVSAVSRVCGATVIVFLLHEGQSHSCISPPPPPPPQNLMS